jgi:non-specific serine/threonine protein kinase/serine/threonine-protein kinase
MGSVFRAERDDGQFQQRVAIKLISAGLEARQEIVQRFMKERQILAGLDHPGIARLLDGGSTDAGAPYLVMEYVDGLAITAWCNRNGLELPARLRLFLKVCEAVAFAHRHLVIHRDLKPANILVTADGEPKLLDFGIAKLLDARGDETQTAARALTFDYASPEQVRGGPVTTASDVYSLGVILYELVAGKRPYSSADRPVQEVIEVVCARDPEPPGRIAGRRVPADVDAIVLKAMRKEATERYASVNDLAADIERHLTSRPVLAQKGTARYVATKFARRHRAGVAIGAVLFATICAATVSVAWQSRVARHERDRAEMRFNDVRGLAKAVIFDLEDKLAALPGTTQVRKDLVAVAIDYLDRLSKDTYADAGLQRELAAAYIRVGAIQGSVGTQNLGDAASAQVSYAKAERLGRQLVAMQASDENRKLLADALIAQADGSLVANDKAGGGPKAMEALRIARERVQSNPMSDAAQFQLGAALQRASNFSGAQDERSFLLEEAAVFERLLARDTEDLRRMRNAALAHKYIAGNLARENPGSAFPHLKRAEELDQACVRRAPNDPEHKMDLAIDLSQLGYYFFRKQDSTRAIEYIRASLALRRELAEADPKDMQAQDRLAYIWNELGAFQLDVSPHEALASYEEAKAVAERLQPDSLRRMELATALSGVGAAYRRLGDMPRSCSAYGEARKLYRTDVQLVPWFASAAAETEKAYATCADGKAAAAPGGHR